MRKLILFLFFLASGTAMIAQNLDDIQEKINKGKFGEAKEKIDKVLADPKNQKSANAWYYKSLVYSELGKDSSRIDMDYRMESFNAYKKYLEVDPKNVMGTLNQNANLFGLYEGYYNRGIKYFNNKEYDKSYSDFKNALIVKDFVHGKKYEINGFRFAAIDTNLLNLTGSAAILAKQEDAAVGYFQQLADAKVKGDDFKEIYPILVDYYHRKKNAEAKAKYIAIGRELYPNNQYWNQVQIEDAGDDKVKRLAKFQEMVKADPTNYDLAIDYGIELFNYTYNTNKPTDYQARQLELHAALSNAIKLNSTAPANYIMAQHLYNQVYDLQQDYNAIKSTKPDDVKKKQAINKNIDTKFDELSGFSQAAYDTYSKMETLKANEKENYKKVTLQLIEYYKLKKLPAKAKVYEDKLKTIK